jgi:hypothetical protein
MDIFLGELATGAASIALLGGVLGDGAMIEYYHRVSSGSQMIDGKKSGWHKIPSWRRDFYVEKARRLTELSHQSTGGSRFRRRPCGLMR